MRDVFVFFFFFFNDTATTEIYTLSYTTLFRSDGRSTFLSNDSGSTRLSASNATKGTPIQRSSLRIGTRVTACNRRDRADRKSTRLNSSHTVISYAVFCLKQKKVIHIKLGV